MDVIARYEFRVWGPDLAEIAARVGDLAEPTAVRESEEIYLAVASSLDVNPKIRDSVLDVKVLIETIDGFERWEPQLKYALPVDRDRLANEFFPLIGVEAPPLARSTYDTNALVADVVAAHPSLAAVKVTKQRSLYLLEGCIAEVSAVTVVATPLQTVAIESEQLDALRSVRDSLGLTTYENHSYPRAIRRALGRAPD